MDLPRRAASSAQQRQPLPFCRRTYLSPSPRCGRRWHSRPQDADVSSFPNSLASFSVWSYGFLNTFSLDRIFSSPNHHTYPLFPQRPASGIAMPLGRQICGTSPHTHLALSLAGPQSDIGWVVIDGPFCFCFCPVCPAQTARHPPPRLQTIFHDMARIPTRSRIPCASRHARLSLGGTMRTTKASAPDLTACAWPERWCPSRHPSPLVFAPQGSRLPSAPCSIPGHTHTSTYEGLRDGLITNRPKGRPGDRLGSFLSPASHPLASRKDRGTPSRRGSKVVVVLGFRGPLGWSATCPMDGTSPCPHITSEGIPFRHGAAMYSLTGSRSWTIAFFTNLLRPSDEGRMPMTLDFSHHPASLPWI